MGADRPGRHRRHRQAPPGQPGLPRQPARRQEGQGRAAHRGGQGRHTGTAATLDDLFADWVVELRRKGRSPNTIRGYEQVYRHDISARLGARPVRKITTKMLTDLYGAHQNRGLSPRSVYQIHACLSSMFTQACRWGRRDSNPAQWADPPSIPNTTPVVPDPEQVRMLVEAARRSRRPEYARALFITATTDVRRAELSAAAVTSTGNAA